MIKKYRARDQNSVVVEAFQHTDIDERRNISRWINSHGTKSDCYRDGTITIENAGVDEEVRIGDWIVKTDGEFHSCTPYIFNLTYEEVI